MLKQRRLTQPFVILSLLGFIFSWSALTNAWSYSDRLFPGDVVQGEFLYAIISRAVWVLPACILIALFSGRLSIHAKNMVRKPPSGKLFFATLCLSLLYCGILMLVFHGGFWRNAEESVARLAIRFLVVGIVEETVFRGWGYNALAALGSRKRAVVISTAAFVVLHWPAYIISFFLTGAFHWSGILSQSAAAMVWGVTGCLLFRKDGSIWSAIAAHSFYDFIFTVFVG